MKSKSTSEISEQTRRYRFFLFGLVFLVAAASFASGWLFSTSSENPPTTDAVDGGEQPLASTPDATQSADVTAPTPNFSPTATAPANAPTTPAPTPNFNPTATAPVNAPTTPAPTPSQEPLAKGTEQSADPSPEATPPPTPTPATQPSPTATATSTNSQLTYREALDAADRLAAFIYVPSDCGIPIDHPISLPNSPRDYRSGIHKGIDFICAQTGRSAYAALDGRVVVAVGDYIPPSPQDRDAILRIAHQVGETPTWTLAMLYGNYVVIDHGIIEGVGHTTSLYAHLAAIDPTIKVGQFISAGARLGEIGNLGTSASSTGVLNYNSLHLHWEIYVDNEFLGAGLGPSETRDIYARLFSIEP